MLDQLRRLWRHYWLDERDTRRTLPDAAAARLQQQVTASEHRHSGEIRICVEAGLPASYLWRQWRHGLQTEQIVRERALMMFAKLRVWDTEHNNGVLIYLLLAEQAIELVADRALAREVPDRRWAELAQHLGTSLHEGLFEAGLSEAVGAVSALLEQHFPPDETTPGPRRNQLPDDPVLR